MGQENYYQILRIHPQSGHYGIKRAYRQLALQYHPNCVTLEQKTEAEKIFRKIAEAYFVLGHRQRRKMYDKQLLVEESVASDKWNFIEVQVNAFNPDAFNYYYREELADCSALKIDWRDFWGGTIAKIWAGLIFLLFFFLGQNVVPFLSIKVAEIYYSIPVILALLYIVLESLRDFFWEHVVDDEDYDVAVLGMCWLILIGFTCIAFTKSLNPQTSSSAREAVSAAKEKKSANPYSVNLEIFNHPIDPYSTNVIRDGGQI